MKYVFAFVVLIASIPLTSSAQSGQKGGVEIKPDEARKRVDIFIDGSLFTSFRWNEDLKKPILFPINTARGTVITRGFPVEPRPGESVDHPHQSGLWLNYGDVNGVDFWNNSIYRTAEELRHMGTIVHRRIVHARNGKTNGELSVEADWLMPDGKNVVRESTKYVFHTSVDSRIIDQITTLTALDKKVVFGDSKEGMFGLRVRRELEQPAKEPVLLTDANGNPSSKGVLNNTKATGEFRSSEGKAGDAVWGTRAKWTTLSGRVGDEDVTIAIFDDPVNLGFPGYWMARGYGLFAINPLGRKAYENKEPVNFILDPDRSVKFRYRVLILSKRAAPNELEEYYQGFITQVKSHLRRSSFELMLYAPKPYLAQHWTKMTS